MRIFTLCSLILISTNFFAQSLKIDVEWDGEKSYTLGGNTFLVPETKNFKNNFNSGEINLSDGLEDQGEIVLHSGDNSSSKKN